MSDPLVEDTIPTFNPPPGWKSSAPPPVANEAELLRKAFGDPIDGVYAPHVEA